MSLVRRWILKCFVLALWIGAAAGGSNGAEIQSGSAMTIVALGDSTTAGTPGFRSAAEFPPGGEGNEQSQYAYWVMKRHPEWRVLNRGVAGERSDEILKRFERDVLAFKPQAVILLAGVNDLYQGYDVTWVKRHLTGLYERARQANLKVVACTILPSNEASRQVWERMQGVNEWIHTYSLEHDLAFCDTSRTVEDPENPGSLAGTPDGLHPDVEGYRKMGEAIAACLEERLPEEKRSN